MYYRWQRLEAPHHLLFAEYLPLDFLTSSQTPKSDLKLPFNRYSHWSQLMTSILYPHSKSPDAFHFRLFSRPVICQVLRICSAISPVITFLFSSFLSFYFSQHLGFPCFIFHGHVANLLVLLLLLIHLLGVSICTYLILKMHELILSHKKWWEEG